MPALRIVGDEPRSVVPDSGQLVSEAMVALRKLAASMDDEDTLRSPAFHLAKAFEHRLARTRGRRLMWPITLHHYLRWLLGLLRTTKA